MKTFKCSYCNCPVAVPYVTDTSVFCDNVCAVLDDEAHQAEFQAPANLTYAEVNELMDS